jgi:hypothetical protein
VQLRDTRWKLSTLCPSCGKTHIGEPDERGRKLQFCLPRNRTRTTTDVYFLRRSADVSQSSSRQIGKRYSERNGAIRIVELADFAFLPESPEHSQLLFFSG